MALLHFSSARSFLRFTKSKKRFISSPCKRLMRAAATTARAVSAVTRRAYLAVLDAAQPNQISQYCLRAAYRE